MAAWVIRLSRREAVGRTHGGAGDGRWRIEREGGGRMSAFVTCQKWRKTRAMPPDPTPVLTGYIHSV